MYYNNLRHQHQQPQYVPNRRQQYQPRQPQPQQQYRQNNNKPFTLAVGQYTPSKSGDGYYQTLTLKVAGSQRGEYVWKTYLTINNYGAFTGLTYEELEELYYALGDLLGVTQQQPQPPQQHQQPYQPPRQHQPRQRQTAMPTPPPPQPQSQQDTEEDELPF